MSLIHRPGDAAQVDFFEVVVDVAGALEFLRYAIDALPSNTARRKEIRDLVTANLADGTIGVDFETQDGVSYSVERDAFGKPLVRDAEGRPTELTDPRARGGLRSRRPQPK